MSKYLEALSLKRTGFWSDKRLIELVRRLPLVIYFKNGPGKKLLLTSAHPNNRQHRARDKDFHPLVRRLWEPR